MLHQGLFPTGLLILGQMPQVFFSRRGVITGGKADNSIDIDGSSRWVAQPADECMLMGDIFGIEGGNYLIEVDPSFSNLVPGNSEYSVLTHAQNVM